MVALRVIVEPTVTDVTLNPLTIPTNHCLICGVAGDRGGGNCPRCGATDTDVRLLLRVGAKAYADARTNALDGEFVRARENLRLAASLGLAETEPWRQLSELLEVIDPPVAAEDARNYHTARRDALDGKYFAGQILGLPPPPAARELRQLCEVGTVLQKKQTWLTTTKYAAVGITCAVIAFCFSIPFKYGGVPQETAKQTVPPLSGEPVSTPSPTPNTQYPTPNPVSVPPTPYPYPERLARRYYNDALSAYREKRYDNAIFLADLATETSKNTYLLPHTLLLRAQIADSTGDTNASQFWAKIATDSPTSPYAPLGLLRAAERAKKIIGKQTEVASYLQELIDRYPLSNEARVARKWFHPVLLPGKAKEEALH